MKPGDEVEITVTIDDEEETLTIVADEWTPYEPAAYVTVAGMSCFDKNNHNREFYLDQAGDISYRDADSKEGWSLVGNHPYFQYPED